MEAVDGAAFFAAAGFVEAEVFLAADAVFVADFFFGADFLGAGAFFGAVGVDVFDAFAVTFAAAAFVDFATTDLDSTVSSVFAATVFTDFTDFGATGLAVFAADFRGAAVLRAVVCFFGAALLLESPLFTDFVVVFLFDITASGEGGLRLFDAGRQCAASYSVTCRGPCLVKCTMKDESGRLACR